MNNKPMGVFYGVGVGPGDPELITRKAERVLREVDWIFLPQGARSGTSFVRRIVEPLGLPAEKFRPVALCMSHERGEVQRLYSEAALSIVAELRQGKSVAWITEGDPLFYSTFSYIHEELRRVDDVRIEIVPGVTSPSAGAARAGLCVARLDERVAVIPAAYGMERLPALIDEFRAVFLLKVQNVFDQLLDALANLRVPLDAVFVDQVGTPAERIVTNLETLRGQDLSYFSLVMLRRREPCP